VFIVTPFVLDEDPDAARDSSAPEHNDTPHGWKNQAVPPEKTPQNKLKTVRHERFSASYSVAVFLIISPAALLAFRSKQLSAANSCFQDLPHFPAEKTEKSLIICHSRLESRPFPGYITVYPADRTVLSVFRRELE